MKKNFIKFLFIILLLNFTLFLPARADDDTIMDKALTPVGWAIGGAISPFILAGEGISNTMDWVEENVSEPVLNVVGKGIEYTIYPVFKGAFWTFDEISSGIFWGLDKTYTGLEYGFQYTLFL